MKYLGEWSSGTAKHQPKSGKAWDKEMGFPNVIIVDQESSVLQETCSHEAEHEKIYEKHT